MWAKAYPPSLTPAAPALPHPPASLCLPLAQAQPFPPPLPVPGPSTSPSIETLNALPDARYLHRKPRHEQEFLEDQPRRDTERNPNEKRTKQSVTIYAWNQDPSPRLIRVFHAGFTWPFFVLTPRILSLIGLADAAGCRSLQIYETVAPSLGAHRWWTQPRSTQTAADFYQGYSVTIENSTNTVDTIPKV